MMAVRQVGAGSSVIDLSGEITPASETALMEAYARTGSGPVILNFSQLEYMNSGGIGLLVTLLIRAQRQGRRLSAVGLNDHYRNIFELTRLDEAIRVFDSEAEAAAAA
jgi:anti-sigma B factor antagonist